ncbi:UDP-N-acetylglucosamine--undecaprenyl-phosphate N-acetylglucosaminephosphotransferase [Aliivibrio fischeri]|uniref:UDP-N-acetylglucosamine--undecaprenyl-phosphate N-acetylglucosaminephosphotransferase n=1 Tax=Aliivibrio fischeri TaxID=668 RepID=UPI0012D93C6D|nr:UDP-N-acetylglucosamine--undecaprenyl-phosphate N-acetylglucosaminephosphotransferase [Aliivibrio fischeri]MUK26507.1 UDP-N-acetylglucosamine--undecaprenyl-phosphate N-acetylglucosaminephosphotransferase [Aliivibrio fischeri]MUK33731.1 UDP-N-acetylglucosamine--undecaprenyl-phosphate N-acetylglucosaminephosphotransferase [Aliivibrio fischeri]
MPHTYFELGFTFFVSLSILFMMRKVAQQINLIDRPNERKHHQGAIPLVGGISICIAFMHFLISHPDLLPNYRLYLLSIFILTLIGAIDDKIDLSFKIRLLIQAVLSVAMMMIADIQLHQLGNMFGFGDMNLTGIGLGYLITVFAVIGAINAFNMVDGIDGLLGGLSIVTFAGLGGALYLDEQFNLAYLCLVLIVIILPYVLLNLGVFTRRYKVFMGDAGSMLIGFTVIWFLLLASQNGTKAPLRPVTALWLIAVPLMDMTAIMIRRIRRGDSPFKPDREHLHHIFQRLGFSSLQTLLIICGIAATYAAFGIYGEMVNIPEYVMFYLFIGCFLVYALLLSNVWKVSAKVREWRGIV